MKIRTIPVAVIALIVGATLAFAAATKEEAVAMVKSAVAMIKTAGPDKAYADFNKGGPYVRASFT